jgi:uncharacterized protein
MQAIKCPFYRYYLLVLLLLACHIATAQDFSVAQIPDPMRQGNHVANPDQLISPAAEQALNILLDSLDRSGRAQVAVILLKTIGSQVPKDVAHEIFNTWKPGYREKNNGLVVLFVNDQRRIEFETGYGLEGDLPDVVCFRIQQHIMLPYFRQQDYDNGMIQGLQAVVSVLHGQDVQNLPAAEDNTAVGIMQSEAPERETPRESSVILYFAFLVIGGISFLVAFYRDKLKSKQQSAPSSKPALLYRPGWIALVWLFAMPWIVILCLVKFTLVPVGVFTVAMILYAHCIVFWCYYIAAVNREATGKTMEMDRYNSYLIWKQAKPYLLLGILFPLPLLPFYFRVRKRLHQLRFDPYYCQSCNDIMQRIDEKADDTLLQKYQVVEETIGSIDYDVWQCSGCNTILIYGYDNDSSNAAACPECTHKTLQTTHKEIMQSATSSSSGWGYQYYACGYCSFQKKETYSIPATGSSSDSSSGSSGSSSSGGSWGGGSSGGGGAGSSW